MAKFNFFFSGYFEEGFLAIQFAIDRAIVDYMEGKKIDSEYHTVPSDTIIL